MVQRYKRFKTFYPVLSCPTPFFLIVLQKQLKIFSLFLPVLLFESFKGVSIIIKTQVKTVAKSVLN